MIVEKKARELKILLKQFLEDKTDAETLNIFIWSVIDYFSNTPDAQLPEEKEGEGVFWYAIWQIQHLIAENNFSENDIHKKFLDILNVLDGRERLPKGSVGNRP